MRNIWVSVFAWALFMWVGQSSVAETRGPESVTYSQVRQALETLSSSKVIDVEVRMEAFISEVLSFYFGPEYHEIIQSQFLSSRTSSHSRDNLARYISEQNDPSPARLIVQAAELVAQNESHLDKVVRVAHARQMRRAAALKEFKEKTEADGGTYYGASTETPIENRKLLIIVDSEYEKQLNGFWAQLAAWEKNPFKHKKPRTPIVDLLSGDITRVSFGPSVVYRLESFCRMSEAESDVCSFGRPREHWAHHPSFSFSNYMETAVASGVPAQTKISDLTIQDIEFALGADAEDIAVLYPKP